MAVSTFVSRGSSMGALLLEDDGGWTAQYHTSANGLAHNLNSIPLHVVFLSDKYTTSELGVGFTRNPIIGGAGFQPSYPPTSKTCCGYMISRDVAGKLLPILERFAPNAVRLASYSRSAADLSSLTARLPHASPSQFDARGRQHYSPDIPLTLTSW